MSDPTPGAGLNERDFEVAADRALRKLEQGLNDLSGLEADLESGILTVEFDHGVKYVINSHRAARQIWMAAVATAWHFDPFDDGRWLATRTNEELRPTLAKLLLDRVGVTVSL